MKEEFESRLATTEKTVRQSQAAQVSPSRWVELLSRCAAAQIILLKSERENLLKRLDAAHAVRRAAAASAAWC